MRVTGLNQMNPSHKLSSVMTTLLEFSMVMYMTMFICLVE